LITQSAVLNIAKSNRILLDLEPAYPIITCLRKSFTRTAIGGKSIRLLTIINFNSQPRAVRELVDNAIEAGAAQVNIILDRYKPPSTKHTLIGNIAVIDDGPRMCQFSLTWGGGLI
jgi:hypothetical protein